MPSGEFLVVSRRIVEMLPGDTLPLQARTDGVPDDEGQFLCMEVEVIDPGLGLDLSPGAADRLAEATLKRVG